MEGVHRAFAQKDHEIIIGEGSDGDGDVDSTTFRLPSLPPIGDSGRTACATLSRYPPTEREGGDRPAVVNLPRRLSESQSVILVVFPSPPSHQLEFSL